MAAYIGYTMIRIKTWGNQPNEKTKKERKKEKKKKKRLQKQKVLLAQILVQLFVFYVTTLYIYI